MKPILFFMLLCVAIPAAAQDTASRTLIVAPNSMDHPVQPSASFWRIVYYNADWQPLKNKKDAVYYRTPGIKNGPRYELECFRADNTRLKTCSYLPKVINYQLSLDEGVAVKDGPFIFYDEQGNIESEGYYTDDKKTGEWKLYKNGVLVATEQYENGVRQ